MAAMKPQDFRCPSCGHQWIGTNTVCSRCDDLAKSEGEMTRKVLDAPDMKKGMR